MEGTISASDVKATHQSLPIQLDGKLPAAHRVLTSLPDGSALHRCAGFVGAFMGLPDLATGGPMNTALVEL